MTIAAVIGAWRHIVWIWITYDETRTVTARASGSFQSLVPPMTRKSSPIAQPTNTLMMRLLNIWAALFTSGSDAASIEAMAQIGLVSATYRSMNHTRAEAMNTLTANRIPTGPGCGKLGPMTHASP